MKESRTTFFLSAMPLNLEAVYLLRSFFFRNTYSYTRVVLTMSEHSTEGPLHSFWRVSSYSASSQPLAVRSRFPVRTLQLQHLHLPTLAAPSSSPRQLQRSTSRLSSLLPLPPLPLGLGGPSACIVLPWLWPRQPLEARGERTQAQISILGKLVVGEGVSGCNRRRP